MAADIGQIAQLLDATLDPTEHRKGTWSVALSHYFVAPRFWLETNKQPSPTAETALKQEATKPQYSLSLLNIVNSDTLPPKTRLAAALAFKNFIRTNYVVRLTFFSVDPAQNTKSRTPCRTRKATISYLKMKFKSSRSASSASWSHLPPIFRPSLVTLSALLQTLISGDDGIPLHRWARKIDG